jgi:hypothetical protein
MEIRRSEAARVFMPVFQTWAMALFLMISLWY